MASTTLYPPIVESTAPAFVASGDTAYCRFYFSLSKYSSSTSPIKSIHISIVKQSSGQSVVRKTDNNGRYRSTGIIILNTAPIKVDDADNLYYVDILNEDVQSGDYAGWYPGWIYKMQIRLSTVEYGGTIGQTAWLNANSNNFSEWSTYCTTKAISQPRIIIPILKNFDSEVDKNNANKDIEYSLSTSTLEFTGEYSNTDITETLYSYQVQLWQEENLIEDTGTLYSNQYYTPNQFYYLFKTELKDSNSYILKLIYSTINNFTEEYDFNIAVSLSYTEETTISAITIDNVDNIDDEDFKSAFKDLTSLEAEQEEGRIGVKLFSNSTNPYNGNICLRRSDSRDNFSTWSDIKIITCINTIINSLSIIFDYTVESGVWYKYGVQVIGTDGERGIMNSMTSSLIREWEFSYLLGENDRQLKLKYDNQMNSYSYTLSESKTDTIGGRYPFITRNGNTNYRTFPINGLVSFNMDDNELFTSDKELYKYSDVVAAYKDRRIKEDLSYYDYKREHDFREKVLEFLQDGKPKLFKSASEGNIIVRLMQVQSQPNQSLNRLVYSFSSTANEIAEPTMENYSKYGFYDPGTYSTSFEFYTTKIGQLDLDFNIGDNIIDKIYEYYDFSDQNIAGIRRTLKSIHHLNLTFTDKPLRVYNNASEEVIGNNFSYNGSIITVANKISRMYTFDENIKFSRGSNITVLGGIEDIYDKNGRVVNTVHITVDFLYESIEEPFVDKEIETKTTTKGIGQIFETYKPGEDLYKDIYYKYYYEWTSEFRRLNRVTWTCIEANPGTIFQIQDESDTTTGDPSTMYHEINWTGVLNLENLGTIKDVKYIGVRNADGSIDSTKKTDIILDYIYYITEGTYKKED